MAKTKKISIITSSILIVLIVVSIIVATLAWFNSSIIDELSVQTKGYIVLYFEGELTADGNVLKPATATDTAIRDGKNPKTVLENGSDGISVVATSVGLSGNVKFIDFSANGSETKTIRASIKAFAINDRNEKTELSISRDISVVPSFVMNYEDGTETVFSEDTYKSFKTNKDCPDPCVDLPINAKNGTLSINLNCYIAEVDELAVPAIINAKKINFALTVQVVENTKILYFYNSNAWSEIYAYATTKDLQAIGANGSYFIVSERLKNNSTQYGLTMKKNPDPTANDTTTVYRYLGYRYEDSNDNFTVNFSGTDMDLSSFTITGGQMVSGDNKIIITAGKGVYDVYLDPTEKTLEITRNDGTISFDRESLGSFPGQKAQPVYGQTGWFYVNVPFDVEKVCFNDGKTKNTLVDVDFGNNYYCDGTWQSNISDKGNRIFFYAEKSGLTVSATYYDDSGNNATITMSDAKNGWYYADVGANSVKIDFSYADKNVSANIQIDDGKLYFYDNEWHFSPKVIS